MALHLHIFRLKKRGETMNQVQPVKPVGRPATKEDFIRLGNDPIFSKGLKEMFQLMLDLKAKREAREKSSP
jgi:hypothetical protein